MYLLYVDESGPDDRDHFVVAGFAVHEQDAWRATGNADAAPPMRSRFTLERLGTGAWP